MSDTPIYDTLVRKYKKLAEAAEAVEEARKFAESIPHTGFFLSEGELLARLPEILGAAAGKLADDLVEASEYSLENKEPHDPMYMRGYQAALRHLMSLGTPRLL